MRKSYVYIVILGVVLLAWTSGYTDQTEPVTQTQAAPPNVQPGFLDRVWGGIKKTAQQVAVGTQKSNNQANNGQTTPSYPAWNGKQYTSDNINDKTDVNGLDLSMTLDQTKKAMARLHPRAKGTKLTVKVGTEYYKQSFDVGYYYEIEPTVVEKDRWPSASDRPGEFIKVISSPSTNNVIGIFHYKGYLKGHFPTREVVLRALIKKYGQPRSSGGVGNTEYTWIGNANTIKHPISGLQYQPGTCGVHNFGGGESLLYEQSGVIFENGQTTFESGVDVARDTAPAFVAVMDRIEKDNKHYAGCGIVLRVHISRAEGGLGDYISDIEQRIVDFDKANTELLQVGDDFQRRADEARDAKLKGDSSRRPDL